MRFIKEFLICPECGRVALQLCEGAGPLKCCESEMQPVKPSTEGDELTHQPVLALKGSLLQVKVSKRAHPMTHEHKIQWVAVVQGQQTQLLDLRTLNVPSALFSIRNGPATVYAYCNQHGLWTADLD